MKLYHITYVDDLQWIIRFIQNLYRIHVNTKSPERKEYFANFALATEIMFKVMTPVYISSAFIFLLYPLYMYFFENELVPILPLYLPFVDQSTVTGYIILNTYLIIAILFATCGLLGCDFFMTIITVSTLIFAKLMTIEMKQICADLQVDNSAQIVKRRFRNMLLMHQEMIK